MKGEPMLRGLRIQLVSAGVMIVLTAGLTLACSNPSSPSVAIGEIQIESVDVRVIESSPPQAAAHVRGILGDGCSEFHSLT
jgi:hypothetical protein